jgi:hypothetical protein
MTGGRLAENERCAATRERHYVVAQPGCAYCGASVQPWFDRNTGRTRGLDHFVPVRLLAQARRWYPGEPLPNWLVPCCRRCNTGVLKDCLFSSFLDKFDFARWSLATQGAASVWRLSDNPAAAGLASIAAPPALLAAVKSFDAIGAAGRIRIVTYPERLGDGWRLARRVLCAPQIRYTEPSAMASLPSPASMPGYRSSMATLS